MSLSYIRRAYNPLAKRGALVEWMDSHGHLHIGTIDRGNGQFLRVRFRDIEGGCMDIHPGQVRFLEGGGK